jgi:hypothetical protein
MNVAELLKPYLDNYNKDNEYLLNNNIPTRNYLPLKSEFILKIESKEFVIEKVKRKFDIAYLSKEAIEILHPDKINNKLFWETLNQKYKLLSICGGECKNKIEANFKNLQLSKFLGTLDVLTNVYKTNKSPKILEIGYGLGNIYNFLKENFSIENYYGVDIIKRIKGDRFFANDGINIPEAIPCNLDVVYSVNVFQHLSYLQKLNYLSKSYDLLRKKGIMIFTIFLVTNQNKNSYFWSYRDIKENQYCLHFGQFTEVDHIETLKSDLNLIGFKIVSITNPHTNIFTVIVEK